MGERNEGKKENIKRRERKCVGILIKLRDKIRKLLKI